MSKEMKVALIGAAAIIVAALIGLVPILVSRLPPPPYPTPTQTGVPPTPTATQPTQDAQSPPDVKGKYFGGATDYAHNQLLYVFTLAITQQNQQSFQGTYAESFPANSYYSIKNGTVDQNGTIQFTITGSDSNGNQITIKYTGTAQSSGGLHGTWSDSKGVKGTWDASKTG